MKVRMNANSLLRLESSDALIVVDVQNDFLPGGSLAVPRGDRVVPVLNRYLRSCAERGLPIYATRDWHPVDHCSFKDQGGIWPPHCIAGSRGAEFAHDLALPAHTSVISKGVHGDKEAYSGFQGTELARLLKERGVKRLFIGGLATDYCVLNTVKDAIAEGFHVCLLEDAVRAVNLEPHDREKALQEMRRLGATAIREEIVQL